MKEYSYPLLGDAAKTELETVSSEKQTNEKPNQTKP